MSTSLAVRLAVAISAVGAVLAALALALTLGGERPASARVAASQNEGRPSPENDDVLAQLDQLRAEIEELREALAGGFRRDAQGASGLEDGEAASDAGVRDEIDRAAAFIVRDELLRNFASLSDGERKSALGTLSELARWGDTRALELLKASLNDPSASIRARVIRELGKLDDPALMEHLRLAAADPSRSVRTQVADALRRMPREEAGPILVQMLGDPKQDVVFEALRSIDRLNYKEARPRLQQHLAASDLDLAARAASLLDELGDKGASATVVQRILDDLAGENVAGRIRDVKRLRTLGARSELQAIVDSDASSSVRYEAQKALARLED